MPRLRTPIALALLAIACAPAGGAAQTGPRGASGGWSVPRLAPPAPISREEHAGRRAALAAAMEGDGVLVVFGAGQPEADYASFTQTPALRYLAGITESGAALVLAKRAGRVSERLFVLPRDPGREVWEGARLGTEGARALTGIPTSPAGGLDAAVDSLLEGSATLYTLSTAPGDARGSAVLSREQQLVRRMAARNPGTTVAELDDALMRLRAAKSPAETDLIRRAVLITVLAQREVARALEPGMNEFEVEALVEGTFRRNGAEGPSFASIVGSGRNSTALHYNADDRFAQAGEVVVVDVGASYRGYAADVTRTFPTGGTFSPEQRAVYQVVLDAQKAAEVRARPGVTWSDLNAVSDSVVAAGLARIGLIESPAATYDCAANGGRCPQLHLWRLHGLGHGIGLDVHDPDVSYLGGFREGSVFTIEPGVYVRADVLDRLPDTPSNRALAARLRPVAERFRDIGVRIEDDYVMTRTGVERLSEGAPREIAEVEALMRQPSPWTQLRHPEVVEWYRSGAPR